MFIQGRADSIFIHIVIHHFGYYFQQTGKTLKDTNGEFTETCHHTLTKEEDTFGLKNVRKLGTPMHQYRSMKMLTIHNSLRLGNVKPMKRKRRKKNSSSPTSFSSTASPLATTSFPSTPSPLATTSFPSTPSPLATTRSKQSPFSHVFMQRYPESVALHYKDK